MPTFGFNVSADVSILYFAEGAAQSLVHHRPAQQHPPDADSSFWAGAGQEAVTERTEQKDQCGRHFRLRGAVR